MTLKNLDNVIYHGMHFVVVHVEAGGAYTYFWAKNVT